MNTEHVPPGTCVAENTVPLYPSGDGDLAKAPSPPLETQWGIYAKIATD